jgi:AraC-like DNA-binding protein
MVGYGSYTRRKFWMHRHAELEMNLVTAGRARYLLDNRRYDLFPNCQVWLFPEQNHLLLDQSADHRMWTLVFKPEFLQRICPGYFCRRLADDQVAWLVTLFGELVRAEQDTVQYNAGLAFTLLSAWTVYQTAGASSLGFDVHPAVETAARLIQQETEPLGIDELALRAGLSACHLSRLFHEQTGVTLVDFRNRQRLERFLQLYGQGRRTNMLEAAMQAGFGSYAQFHRVFKRMMGYAPAEYRRNQHAKGSARAGQEADD